LHTPYAPHAALIRAFAITACSLCLIVVVLGAYVRLSDAGLGCPDWPGCYGHFSPIGAEHSGQAMDAGKAWREMLHRYAAGTLGLLIVCLAAMTLAWRRERIAPLRLTLALPAIVIIQGLFGMLTVTWRLKPLIVTLHLLFGLSTLSLLWWLVLELARRRGGYWSHGAGLQGGRLAVIRALALLALLALAAQIALGGWTSSNYAALACPDLPTCRGSWWPRADFRSGYRLWRDIEAQGLVAIHLLHRLGAMVASVVLATAAIAALAARAQGLARRAALLVLALLCLQLTIGMTMVLRGFPLWLATAHNAGAALLLLATLALNSSLRPAKP
jgi:cytochrome c oxidase assembly protein subunit 15